MKLLRLFFILVVGCSPTTSSDPNGSILKTIGFPEEFQDNETGYICQFPISWEIFIHDESSFRATIPDHRIDADVWIDGFPTADLFDGKSLLPSEIPLRRSGAVVVGGKKIRRFVYVRTALWRHDSDLLRQQENDLRQQKQVSEENRRKLLPFVLSIGSKHLREAAEGDRGFLVVTRGGKVEASEWTIAEPLLSLETAFDTMIVDNSLSGDTIALTTLDTSQYSERAKLAVGDAVLVQGNYRYKGTMKVGQKLIPRLIAE